MYFDCIWSALFLSSDQLSIALFTRADNHVRVESFGPGNTFNIDPATPPLYGFLAGARFYAENLIEELDTASEYFIDYDTNFLFLHAEADVSKVVLSMGTNIVSLGHGVSNLKFEGLRLGFSQGDVLTTEAASNVTISNCTLFNGEARGAVLEGTDLLMQYSTVHGLGCNAVHLTGGDRKSLTHGRLRAKSNLIFDYARWKRTYQPGVSFFGVGIHVLDNDISGAPHQGVSGAGNECLFEGNYVHDLCYEASDSGAFYVGRSWSQRGNRIVGNIFENVQALESTVLGYLQVIGVYLDDQMSGWEIVGNSFINAQMGILVGGGRHNTVENNTFVDCDIGINLDDRGLTWDTSNCPPGGAFQIELEGYNYTHDPWLSRYPMLPGIYDDNPCTPIHNSIQGNRYCGVPLFLEAYANASDLNTIASNSKLPDCTDDEW